MMENLLLPFQFVFMQKAFLIAAIVSVPTALLSCFLVLKGWALMGDAVSHAVLPGIVLAWITGLPLIVGAFGAGMTCALLTGYLSDNSRVKQDTVMGVVFSGMFGIGLILFTSIHTNEHLDHVLFGNMLGVEPQDLWTAGLISLGVTAVLALKWKDFLLHAFDPAQAKASGLPVNLLHYGLLSILSLTIVATLSATGLILAVGLLIAPGAIAFLLVRSFGAMLVSATIVCALAMQAGIYLSFFLDSAPAPTVILILTAVFLLALLRRLHITRATSGKERLSAPAVQAR
jgi:manganese/iron transport system permease protein